MRFNSANVTSIGTGESCPEAQNEVSKEKLVQDLKLVIADAEELLKRDGLPGRRKVAAARERIQDRIHTAKIKLAGAEEAVLVSTREAAKATDEFVHDKPWYAVGIAAGVGLIVGMLIGRR